MWLASVADSDDEPRQRRCGVSGRTAAAMSVLGRHPLLDNPFGLRACGGDRSSNRLASTAADGEAFLADQPLRPGGAGPRE